MHSNLKRAGSSDDQLAAEYPIKRVGQPCEVANLVLFLFEHQSNSIGVCWEPVLLPSFPSSWVFFACLNLRLCLHRAFHNKFFSECCLWLKVLTDYSNYICMTLNDFVCAFGSTRFLTSDEASFITAQDITVDGGITSLGRWAKVSWADCWRALAARTCQSRMCIKNQKIPAVLPSWTANV